MNISISKQKEFGLLKFDTNDSQTVIIRSEILPSGKVVVFGIAVTDLSILELEIQDINFDAESEMILRQVQDSKINLVYQYEPGTGFIETDTKTQKWFTL